MKKHYIVRLPEEEQRRLHEMMSRRKKREYPSTQKLLGGRKEGRLIALSCSVRLMTSTGLTRMER